MRNIIILKGLCKQMLLEWKDIISPLKEHFTRNTPTEGDGHAQISRLQYHFLLCYTFRAF